MTMSCDDAGTSGVQRFEVFTGAGRRRDWPDEVRASIVAESYSGRETVSAVARRHALSPSQLFTWRRELRKQMEERGVPLQAGPVFVPAVVEAARNQFYLPANDERLEVIEADGAAYITAQRASHDVLMLDAFDTQGLAPDLCSQSFYDFCYRALTDDGILVVNLWGSDKHFDIYVQRIQQSFDSAVLLLPTGRPGNVVAFAFKRHAGDLRIVKLRERAKLLESQLKVEFSEFLVKLHDYNLHSDSRLIV